MTGCIGYLWVVRWESTPLPGCKVHRTIRLLPVLWLGLKLHVSYGVCICIYLFQVPTIHTGARVSHGPPLLNDLVRPSEKLRKAVLSSCSLTQASFSHTRAGGRHSLVWYGSRYVLAFTSANENQPPFRNGKVAAACLQGGTPPTRPTVSFASGMYLLA